MRILILSNDLPTLRDSLDWKADVDRINDRIQNCATPHVMGIHGDWGSGKTSFMRQMEYFLGGAMPEDGSISMDSIAPLSKAKRQELNKKIVPIWFDAWRYQNEPAPVVALLHEMRQQMAMLPAVKDKFKKFGIIALETVLNVLPDIGKTIGMEGIPSPDKIRKIGERWEKESHSEVLNTNSIRDQLLKTIECLLPGKNARLVIFIDDLDRCNPKGAMRLLEGLKIYLSLPHCIFVIGMNERILVDAISEEVSSGTDDKKLRASHYLEKICTDIYRLPTPISSLKLLATWIHNKGQCKDLIDALGNLICLPPNPRRLKALANQWTRFAECVSYPILATNDEKKYWAVRVLIAAYIHQFHRDLWERWSHSLDFWSEIKSWCSGEREGSSEPGWAQCLRLPYHVDGFHEVTGEATISNKYLSPGDIDSFWLAPLILKYRDQLNPSDFKFLVSKAG